MEATLDLKLPYKKLCGFISQTGTGNPTLTILENEFGAASSTRITGGVYNYTPDKAGQFPVNRTVIKPVVQELGANQNITLERGGDNFLQFKSFDGGMSASDGVFSNNYFEVLVYDEILETI